MKRLPFAYILLMGLAYLALGCAISPEAKKARHWNRGVSFFEKGIYREAVLEFRKVVALDPNHAEAYFGWDLRHLS